MEWPEKFKVVVSRKGNGPLFYNVEQEKPKHGEVVAILHFEMYNICDPMSLVETDVRQRVTIVPDGISEKRRISIALALHHLNRHVRQKYMPKLR